ncbi:MAG: cadmium-translocating P-type ATPase [Clostridium sp.]|uniref:Cadmium, zinc and cobalt-transporting ATPase n=1 Tax=Clostridium coskatii TaxID=1705578 RepID=A0A166T5A2_9CLOT|nr:MULTISPECIES: heavy metal translocating P-type ATPase [Clostridium]MCH3964595.1 cadmium-translocating P-type ATPase [Clostridium sp.]MCH4198555.1 cadmium-translocating P-type ATPase [Clostridium tyrobutyricum]MCH4237733.1 cadmium-translocating P-type ATPase [Clostridium tyrobutyricum]MCH4258910.1 cadmium-translocating P-type ATPase [Clostridium tyrobutyricum]MCI1239742.1 cadmium-translocating P-type ATPase [Clostridium tyrobutyricum]
MEKGIKKELVLKGLNCANCFQKIQNEASKVEGVHKASVNFADKTLTIETNDINKINNIITKIRSIVKKIEPDVIVKEKSYLNSPKKALALLGLSCMNCSVKIQEQVGKLNGVKNAHVDFPTGKLIIEIDNKHDLEKITEEAAEIVKKIEPGVNVVDVDKKENSKAYFHDDNAGQNRKKMIGMILEILFFSVPILFKFTSNIEFILYLISYVLVGWKVILKAVRNIARGKVFDENFLMSIATIGAFFIGQYPEGVAVMLFYQIGEFFQDAALNRSKKSIAALMDIRPDYANLKQGEELKKVSPDQVKIGDKIVIKSGEKVPLDGSIIEGESMVDTSALTGESVPRSVQKGDLVLGGFINKNGLLTVEVTKEFGESTVSKILNLVQNSSSRKAPTENFMTKFAKYYTPIVVIIAALLAIVPPLIIRGAMFSDWIYRSLVFLVISCPCALVISIPLGFFGGIGGASKNGVLVKGGNYLEALNNLEIIIFDKTGTLTKGVFEVTKIKTTEKYNKDELLEFAAYAESFSNHPIAVSILKAYGKEVNKEKIGSYDEISGHGIKVKVKGKEVLAGNVKLMNKENIKIDELDIVGTVVYIAIDKEYAGYIIISDEVKDDSKDAIKNLKTIGIKKTVMLTGDAKAVGEKVAGSLSLDEVYAELLPDQKVEELEKLDKQKSAKGKLAFVGDGINDAPVLVRADIGIAMGGLGSDAAIEAADVVIMTDEPSKIVTAVKIAKRTRKIVWQNIILAMVVKIIVLILGAGGIATLWEAVFADVGVTILAIINAMRVMKVKNI